MDFKSSKNWVSEFTTTTKMSCKRCGHTYLDVLDQQKHSEECKKTVTESPKRTKKPEAPRAPKPEGKPKKTTPRHDRRKTHSEDDF